MPKKTRIMPWPGFQIQEVLANWEVYKTLVIQLYIQEPEDLTIYVGARRYIDPPNGAYVQMTLNGGAHHLEIPREKLAPDGTRVPDLLIYSEKKFSGRSFSLGEIGLRTERLATARR